MKDFLVYHSNSQDKTDEININGYIKDNLYLVGFKETIYSGMTFDVCVDGELYNSQYIQQELSKAGFPNADGIEQLFLYAYLLWGMDAMKELEGAYAFTIKKGATIVTIKDPMGLRPIFYIHDERGTWISNSIKTLLDNSGIAPTLDKDGIIELFAFGPSISEEKTLFKDIQALPMGSMLSLRGETLETKTYYELPVYKHEDSLEETIQHVHDLVSDSILKQSKDCDASFLSGGLDSSIIVSVASKQKKSLRTYSLEYEGNAENFKGNMYQVSLDTQFIEDMIAYTNCENTKCLITQQALLDDLDDAMLARNQPGMGDVDSSLLWLCKQVAQHENNIFSGECSDELLGGYPWFYREEFKDIPTFPWLRFGEQRIQLLNKNLRDFDYANYVKERYDETVSSVSFLDSDTDDDKRARVNTVLVLHWFMQTLVTRQVCEGDRANLNIRAPFANVKLLEYVYNIPWSMKFLDNEEKGILRKAFEHELPASIVHRKKNPFPKTHNPLYADLISKKLKRRFDDPTSPLHELFDDEQLTALIESKGASYDLPWYGQLMSGPQLLAYIYQIDQWICAYHITIQ